MSGYLLTLSCKGLKRYFFSIWVNIFQIRVAQSQMVKTVSFAYTKWEDPKEINLKCIVLSSPIVNTYKITFVHRFCLWMYRQHFGSEFVYAFLGVAFLLGIIRHGRIKTASFSWTLWTWQIRLCCLLWSFKMCLNRYILCFRPVSKIKKSNFV